jgi:ribosome-binding factor A
MPKRIERVNELLRHEISQIILREIEFGSNMVTITNVQTTGNMQQAKIKIMVLPDKNSAWVLEKLKKNIWQIQQFLNKKLKMRPVPRIEFVIDQEQTKAEKMEELLAKMENPKDKNRS